MTSEYELPSLCLVFHQQRDSDLAAIVSIRGWTQLHLAAPRPPENIQSRAQDPQVAFKQMALVVDHYDQVPLAVMYRREHNNLGVAWMPNPAFSQVEWVVLIAMEWAKWDKERFPGFGDWTKDSDWMTPR